MRKPFTVLGTLLLLAGARHAVAGPVCPAQAIQLAYYEYAPFYHEGAGIDVDVVEELKRRSACAFSTSLMPRARIWRLLEAGRLDMTVSGIEIPSRTRFGYFYHYILQKNFALISNQVPADVQSLQDFITKTDLLWGVVRNFSYGEFYDAQLAQLRRQNRLHDMPTQIANFHLLKAGRIAGMLAVPMIYNELMPEMRSAGNLRIADWAPEELPVHGGLVLSRARFTPAQAREWGLLIESMNRDGTMLKLLQKYLSPRDAQ